MKLHFSIYTKQKLLNSRKIKTALLIFEKKINFIYLYPIIIIINSKNIYRVHLKCLLNNNSKNTLNIIISYNQLVSQSY